MARVRIGERCACVFDGDQLVRPCTAHLRWMERRMEAALSDAFKRLLDRQWDEAMRGVGGAEPVGILNSEEN